MGNKITETTLEMHYHKPLMDAFKACYGVGPTGHFSFYKYSQQKEKFIGFDQAYVRTELDDDKFYEEIKKAAAGSTTTPKYVGYFLQFKVVEQKINRRKSIPKEITNSPPFFAVTLSTKRDTEGNFSQHELLRNIQASSPSAFVYYACPMLFDKLDLYVDDPDLNQLRLIDVRSAVSDFRDNEPNHHIYFKDKTSNPVWCSEPTDGTVWTVEQMFDRMRNDETSSQEQARILVSAIERTAPPMSKEKEELKLSEKLAFLADCLYLVRHGD
jgi:hypothetical protein